MVILHLEVIYVVQPPLQFVTGSPRDRQVEINRFKKKAFMK